jgi:SAM-dependent methyltransferase
MDIFTYNRKAWDREVEKGNQWTQPVSRAVIAEAIQGRWQIILTPTKPVPQDWFPPLPGAEVLCLASGGGQQGPVLAAAGANVTVLDASPRQLVQDLSVAGRDGLVLRTVEGDMADLSMFADETFDLIIHPVSNCFTVDVLKVWREAFRVLRHGGALLSGFANPVGYIFDHELAKRNILQVRYALPYTDDKNLSGDERREFLEAGVPLEFSHTLGEQIGGQIEAGFVIAGFYEDAYPPEAGDLLSRFLPPFLATRAIKLCSVHRG